MINLCDRVSLYEVLVPIAHSLEVIKSSTYRIRLFKHGYKRLVRGRGLNGQDESLEAEFRVPTAGGAPRVGGRVKSSRECLKVPTDSIDYQLSFSWLERARI